MEKEPLQNFTEATYDKAARGYAEKFKDIGVRSLDVDQVFALVDKENPNVVEIGCGGGREAEYILTKTKNYTGMDVSAGMIEIAYENIPEGNFVKADIAAYHFPESTDIIFAFASLLHSSKEELEVIFNRMHTSLNDDGLVYVSLKRKDEYATAVVEDEYGPREFYYYTRETVLDCVADGFEEVSYEEQEREESWFTMILKKK